MAGIDSYAKFISHFDGADASTTFTDSSLSPKTITRTGAVEVDTAQSKFGGASALFGGGYLTLPDDADLEFGSGDFTLECWVRNSSWSGNQVIFAKGGGADYVTGFFASGTSLYFIGTTNNGDYNFSAFTAYGTLSNNTWHHLAACRSGNNLYLFLDGTLLDTRNVTGLSVYNFASGWSLGATYNGSYPTACWIDEPRISVGVARWTSTFTPPSAAYSNDGYVLTADGATFTLTAYDATLTPVRNLVASAASFALTANAATLRTELKLPAAGASYALTAFDAALRPAFKLAAAAATYTLTANAAALTRTGVLQAAAATYTLTANAATLARSYDFDADAASYTLTAYDAQLYSGQRLQAAGATFTLTAYAASPYAIRYLYPEAAVYTLTAFPATLRKSYLALAAAGAAFTLSAQDARLSFDRRLVAAGASFTLDAKALTLTHGYWLHAEGASFVLSPGEAVLSQARRRINMFPVAY